LSSTSFSGSAVTGSTPETATVSGNDAYTLTTALPTTFASGANTIPDTAFGVGSHAFDTSGDAQTIATTTTRPAPGGDAHAWSWTWNVPAGQAGGTYQGAFSVVVVGK
jgi:hypothetical protein